MFTLNATFDPSRFDRIEQAFAADANGGYGPFRQALRQCGVIYFRDMQERFRQNSQKGGEWPRLSPRTIAARARKGRMRAAKVGRSKSDRVKREARIGGQVSRQITGGINDAILYDTGVLFRALTPVWSRSPGKLAMDIPFGVRVGYGGSSRHPESKGGLTIPEIARIQHFGQGRIPARTIIVEPSKGSQGHMKSALQIGIRELLKSV